MRTADPARVVVATPVSAPESCQLLASIADEVVCLATPDPFYAVGLWYEDFRQTADAEVIGLLEQSEREYAQAKMSVERKPPVHDRPTAR